MYSNQYHFYLEKRNDTISGPVGPFLKYGRKGKNLSVTIDLGNSNVEGSEALNGVMALKEGGNKFKIITSNLTLHLKADSRQERDSWIEAILGVSSTALVLTIRDRAITQNMIG
jgi:hypothetical protein